MLKEKHHSEKRQHPRLKKNLPIKIRNGDFDIFTETKNISCTGAYCQIDKYIAPFTKIKTTILLPAKTENSNCCIKCEGTVVRVEKADSSLETLYNIAVYFNQISKASMSKIGRFIEDHLKI